MTETRVPHPDNHPAQTAAAPSTGEVTPEAMAAMTAWVNDGDRAAGMAGVVPDLRDTQSGMIAAGQRRPGHDTSELAAVSAVVATPSSGEQAAAPVAEPPVDPETGTLPGHARAPLRLANGRIFNVLPGPSGYIDLLVAPEARSGRGINVLMARLGGVGHARNQEEFVSWVRESRPDPSWAGGIRDELAHMEAFPKVRDQVIEQERASLRREDISPAERQQAEAFVDFYREPENEQERALRIAELDNAFKVIYPDWDAYKAKTGFSFAFELADAIIPISTDEAVSRSAYTEALPPHRLISASPGVRPLDEAGRGVLMPLQGVVRIGKRVLGVFRNEQGQHAARPRLFTIAPMENGQFNLARKVQLHGLAGQVALDRLDEASDTAASGPAHGGVWLHWSGDDLALENAGAHEPVAWQSAHTPTP
jgi:hypothetical protein